jgi:hypothetical protein
MNVRGVCNICNSVSAASKACNGVQIGHSVSAERSEIPSSCTRATTT